MVRYETLFLTRTELTDDESSMIERQLDKLVTDAEGTFDTFDKWGKYKLAFPVKKHTHGIYILSRYQLPSQSAAKVLEEFSQFLKIKCNEIVMRHVTIKIKPNAATTYNKPDPIDMSRGSGLDTFFKDNKIESLLSSVDSAKGGVESDDIEDNE
jgi:ribosomal protein S6